MTKTKRTINTNFRLGLNRQELIKAAQQLGKKESVAKKENTKRLEQYIVNRLSDKRTSVESFAKQDSGKIKTKALKGALGEISYRSAKQKNINFRLGLNRDQLIEASQMFGKKESTARKESTKRLEQYLVNKLGGKGTEIPTFSDSQKRDIKDSSADYGLVDGLHLLSYRIRRITNNQDESNFLRLTISRAFSVYYEGGVENKHIDELIRRLPMLNRSEIISDVMRHSSYYAELFSEYAEELEQIEA